MHGSVVSMWPSARREVHLRWKTSVSRQRLTELITHVTGWRWQGASASSQDSQHRLLFGPFKCRGRTHTADVATRNVLLPYFCWRVRAAREKHLSSFSLKLYITSLNAVITRTVLLLQIKLMVMEFVIDMADNHCMCVSQCAHTLTEVCTDSLKARGKIGTLADQGNTWGTWANQRGTKAN